MTPEDRAKLDRQRAILCRPEIEVVPRNPLPGQARLPMETIPIRATLVAAGEIELAPDRIDDEPEMIPRAFLIRFDSHEDLGRAMDGAPVVARWPWEREDKSDA